MIPNGGVVLKTEFFKKNPGRSYRMMTVVICVAINIALSYITHIIGLPMYFDTIGTIAATYLGGVLPGVTVAVITNILCSSFNSNALYYSIISVFMATTSAWFFYEDRLKSKVDMTWYVGMMTALSGLIGITFQWLLLGGPQFTDVAETAAMLSQHRSGPLYFIAALFINLLLNLIDKGISIAVALFGVRLVPESVRRQIMDSKWHQKPLSEERISIYDAASGHHALLRKLTLLLTVSALLLATIMSGISIKLYFDNVKEEYTMDAIEVAKLTAGMIEPSRLNEYLERGHLAAGYNETLKLLSGIRASSAAVEYLYVVKITERGCTFIFDVDTEDDPGYAPGETVPFEEAFIPYIPDLLAGRPIEPIESNDTFGWVMSYYYPIWDKAGNTVAYVGADVSMLYMSKYARMFLVKTILIFSGFCTLIIVFGLVFFRYHLIYPVGSMTGCAKDFVKGGSDLETIENNVRKIRALDIRTNDEIEELYRAVSTMEASMAGQMRDLRHFADATAKMQNGLIVTMADMVENRDSDTGAHVQKTAAYVRIILNGLKKHGYHLAKLSDKYMSDVEMSAPLHDVGKINIPDAVLNKPGKLTPEEFEIMKTHTTAGKKILENAISTVEGENYLKEARNMAAYHHERWDGKGYPDGLHGEVIPLSARVMAVADVFDALTSPRVYKPAFPLDKALQILEEGAGTQFDPKVIEVFMESLPEVKRVLRKYNNMDII